MTRRVTLARIPHQPARPRTTAGLRSAFASGENTASIPSFTETPAKPITCTIIARVGEICGLGLGALSALLFASGCGYNLVVDRDQDVQAAWAEVENQYQRRADLVPNLVNTVKGAASFEQETLQAVVEARSRVGSLQVDSKIIDDPARLKAFEEAQGQLSGALSRLLVVAERYPELKASEAFRDLQVQLEGTENRVAVARRRYIESVAEYNKVVLRIPTSLGAQLRGMKERPTFTATTPGADKAPAVEF